MNILVTGGCGYIGSITAKLLKQSGHKVFILDSQKPKPSPQLEYTYIQGLTSDYSMIVDLLRKLQIQAVVHFAAFIEAGESMQNPGKYFANNYYGSLRLFDAMVEAKVDKLVFSSTAAVYGIPESTPIKEDSLKLPINPYGESKLMVEKTLKWYDKIHNLRSIIIRYFNASGASIDCTLGEDHNPETHLIPNIVKAHQENRPFKLFGDDYNTPDGTCIRDYIHVEDLASAHAVALNALQNGSASNIYNAGTGKGYSNKQIVEMVEKVSGQKIDIQIAPRRPGDPDELVADSSRFQKELGWEPKYSDLETIIQTAWNWHNK